MGEIDPLLLGLLGAALLAVLGVFGLASIRKATPVHKRPAEPRPDSELTRELRAVAVAEHEARVEEIKASADNADVHDPGAITPADVWNRWKP